MDPTEIDGEVKDDAIPGQDDAKSEGSTEEAILKNLEQYDDVSDEGAEETTTPKPSLMEKSKQLALPKKGKEAVDQKPTEQKPNAARPSGAHSYGADGSVLDAQGAIVAKAGAERRLWDRANRSEQRAVAAERAVQEATQRFSQLEQQFTAGKQLGLQPDEQLSAMQLFGWYKRQPEEMLKWFLTDIQARGYNIPKLLGMEQGAGPGIDVITKAIDQRLQPIIQRDQQAQQAAEQQRQMEAQVNQELAAFHQQFPDAGIHEDVLAELIQGQPTLTLNEAYLRLENWAIRNGLDLSKPLRPQWEAAQQQQVQQPRRPAQPAPAMRRGRTMQAETVDQAPSAYNEYRSEDIVRAAMREHGYNV